MKRIALLLVATLLVAGCSEAPAEDTDAMDEASFDEFDLEETQEEFGVIRGVVVDASIQPLSGAIVTVRNLELTLTTGETGAFAFKDVPAGVYFIQVNKTGWSPVQTSVDVVAGDIEPEVTRILMDRVPGSEPSVSVEKFDGHITCSVRIPAAGFNDGCAVWGNLGLGSTQRREYQFESGNIQWIQTDLTWQPNSATSAELCTTVYDASASSPSCGPDNLVRYMDTAAVRESSLHSGGSFEHVTYPAHLAAGASGNLVVEQSFEVFVHAFYNFAPDEGWSFVTDGEHPVPV